jgi:hypothetical protein
MGKQELTFSRYCALVGVFVIRFLTYIFFYLYIVGAYVIKGNVVAMRVVQGKEWREDETILDGEIEEIETKLDKMRPKVLNNIRDFRRG